MLVKYQKSPCQEAEKTTVWFNIKIKCISRCMVVGGGGMVHGLHYLYLKAIVSRANQSQIVTSTVQCQLSVRQCEKCINFLVYTTYGLESTKIIGFNLL